MPLGWIRECLSSLYHVSGASYLLVGRSRERVCKPHVIKTAIVPGSFGLLSMTIDCPHPPSMIIIGSVTAWYFMEMIIHLSVLSRTVSRLWI